VHWLSTFKSIAPAVKVLPVEVSVSEKKAVVAPMANAPTAAIMAKLIIIFFHKI
jgi:hypothetical protein